MTKLKINKTFIKIQEQSLEIKRMRNEIEKKKS
jgi:hypothetical protein